MTCVSKTSSC